MGNDVRIGYVSAYDEAAGTASVYYPDRDGQTTVQMPVLQPFGLKQTLKKDMAVIVVHLSNGGEAAVVLGAYGEDTKSGVKTEDGAELFLYNAVYTTTLTNLMETLANHEQRISSLEASGE